MIEIGSSFFLSRDLLRNQPFFLFHLNNQYLYTFVLKVLILVSFFWMLLWFLLQLKLLYNHNDNNHERRYLVNPLKKSDRQAPPKNIKDLKINDNAEISGQWSAPFDWNVTAIHAILLPDETVMTFGTFAIEKKEENKDIRSNKKLVLTDGRELERDSGSHQWKHHDVNSSIDFDIWDPKKE